MPRDLANAQFRALSRRDILMAKVWLISCFTFPVWNIHLFGIEDKLSRIRILVDTRRGVGDADGFNPEISTYLELDLRIEV